MTIPAPLSAAGLRPDIDPGPLSSALDAGDPGALAAVAQPRALEALRMGADIDAANFHVCVVGPPGSGRLATALAVLEARRECRTPPSDFCYVQRLGDAERPVLLRLPAGQGRRLRDAMADAVDLLRRELPRVFEDLTLRTWRDELIRRFEDYQREVFEKLDDAARRRRLAIERVVVGGIARPDVLVRKGDQRLRFEVAVEALPPRHRDALVAHHAAVSKLLDAAMRDVRARARAVDKELLDLEGRDCQRVVDGVVEDLRAEFGEGGGVGEWLGTLTARVRRRLEVFLGPPDHGPAPEGEAEPPHDDPGAAWPRPGEDAFRDFRVNLLLDNTGVDRRPLVVETNPTWTGLFGSIDRGPDDAAHVPPDFMGIRAGALLRASGGFLVMDAEDAFGEPGLWRNLRRTLKHRLLEIGPSPDPAFAASSLKPDPIPVDVKVVLTADYELYYELYDGDPAFADTFKVKAEFDSEVALRDGAGVRYAAHAAHVCSVDGLPPCDAGAVAALVEAGMREVERRDRVTADFARVADWIREAGFWARRAEAKAITAAHVHAALDARSERHDLVRRLALEEITSGVVVIRTEGERIGQINALTYFDYGDHRYALPSRLSGVIGAGRSGVVSVEREARLSGAIHAKSVLVIMGYLLDRFGQERPLALSASTVFEQSHDLLDGDSASSAETYVILSALAGLPIRQGIAVTGALTQKGEVLAVGGINEKIEGFFDVCASRGLTGEQGVVLPCGNLGSLVLAPRVVDAVAAGTFRIWAVDNVDAGLHVVTGRDPADIHARVAARLGELANAAAADPAPAVRAPRSETPYPV